MREVPPGLKLRVLLAQALFSRPDVLLLDEPTNNLDINSIRWLESALNNYDATMVIISHDRHFLNQVCTHVADLDSSSSGSIRATTTTSCWPRCRHAACGGGQRQGQGPYLGPAGVSCGASPRNASKARQATSRKKQLEKIKIEEIRPSSRQNPYIRFEQGRNCTARPSRSKRSASRIPVPPRSCLKDITINVEAGERIAIIGRTAPARPR